MSASAIRSATNSPLSETPSDAGICAPLKILAVLVVSAVSLILLPWTFAIGLGLLTYFALSLSGRCCLPSCNLGWSCTRVRSYSPRLQIPVGSFASDAQPLHGRFVRTDILSRSDRPVVGGGELELPLRSPHHEMPARPPVYHNDLPSPPSHSSQLPFLPGRPQASRTPGNTNRYITMEEVRALAATAAHSGNSSRLPPNDSVVVGQRRQEPLYSSFEQIIVVPPGNDTVGVGERANK